jgi:adenosylmethionine-8-amino-7-oxononanoate aminotransferase
MASLDILERDQLVANSASMENVLRRELNRLHGAVYRVRDFKVIGLLSSITSDISDQPDPDATVRRARKIAYDNGLLARFSLDGKYLATHFYPPLVVNETDIVNGVQALEAALHAI